MSIIKTDLVTSFGNFYLPEGQNEKRLLSAVRQKSVTPSYAKPIIADGEIYRFSNTKLSEVVQSFQKGFTPKGDATFDPNEIRLRNLKIDLSLYPDDVKASWLGFMADLKDDERKNWPIVRYLLEKEVIPQMHQDMELQGYFKGSYVAPTAGTAGATSASIDGVKKLLDAGIADSSMQNVALSAAPTAANAFEIIEEFVDNFDPALEGVPMRVYVTPTLMKQYLRDKRNTHGTDVNYDPKKPVVDFTNCEIVPLPSMGSENYIWATPVDNFLYLRRANGMKKPKVEESKREVYLMMDWWEGLGFGYNELVYAATWI